jgi:hypothetical protein
MLFATPLAYALTERATQDQIPLLTAGIGRSDAADGRVFPYVFNPPTNFWSQNTAKIRFLGQRAGGMAQLKGRKIAHVYLDNDMGRETIPLLDTQAVRYGFAVQHLAVQPPGLDQKATWLRVKVAQPDWVILRSAGVMTPTALKEAAQVGFPRDKMVGQHGTCAEQDMLAAGEAARGFMCATWYGLGTDFPLIQDILTYVYARGKGPGPTSDVGTGHGIRGLLRAVLTTEGLRTAMRHFGHQPLTGVQAIVSGTNFAGAFCACFACQNRGFRKVVLRSWRCFWGPQEYIFWFHLGGEATLPPLTPSKSLEIPAGNGQELPSKNRAGHYCLRPGQGLVAEVAHGRAERLGGEQGAHHAPEPNPRADILCRPRPLAPGVDVFENVLDERKVGPRAPAGRADEAHGRLPGRYDLRLRAGR